MVLPSGVRLAAQAAPAAASACASTVRQAIAIATAIANFPDITPRLPRLEPPVDLSLLGEAVNDFAVMLGIDDVQGAPVGTSRYRGRLPAGGRLCRPPVRRLRRRRRQGRAAGRRPHALLP